jgi:DNA-binding MarR family transcriptional regulator
MAQSNQEAWQNIGTAGFGVSVVRFPALSGVDLPRTENATLSSAALGSEGMERKLKSIIKHRHSRGEHFPHELFADPAWDILLDLALAELQQRRVTISSLCTAAQVPATTALRWIKHMTQDGWLVRLDDPLDARRTFISLSREASRKMHDCIAGLGQDFSI